MPSAAALRQKRDDARSELEELRADLATVQAHRDEALAAVKEAVRAGSEKREALAAKHGGAEQLVSAQQASIRDLEREIAQLDADLAAQEHLEAQQAAQKRLDAATDHLRDLGGRFRELIEEPQLDIARAFVEAQDAADAAKAAGLTPTRPHLARHLDTSDVANARQGWLNETIVNIGRLANEVRRGQRRERSQEHTDEIERKRQESVRKGRKRQLYRMRQRDHGGERAHRERLEAEVGAELDRELAEPERGAA